MSGTDGMGVGDLFHPVNLSSTRKMAIIINASQQPHELRFPLKSMWKSSMACHTVRPYREHYLTSQRALGGTVIPHCQRKVIFLITASIEQYLQHEVLVPFHGIAGVLAAGSDYHFASGSRFCSLEDFHANGSVASEI